MQRDERALRRERRWATMGVGFGSAAAPARRCGGRCLFPHHKLFAYELCLSLVTLVAKVRIADAQLRAQARKSAASAALNCAEGAARQTRADKSRAYSIALGECCEACAAIEIAGALGACSAADPCPAPLVAQRRS